MEKEEASSKIFMNSIGHVIQNKNILKMPSRTISVCKLLRKIMYNKNLFIVVSSK
jgi:hypothetical protein